MSDDAHHMSLSARHLVALGDALRRGDQPQHAYSWEWMARVLACRLIGEGCFAIEPTVGMTWPA